MTEAKPTQAVDGTGGAASRTGSLTVGQLSHLRHDLRTPFNQIIGYAEMLSEDAEEAKQEPLRVLAVDILAAARATLDLVTETVQREPEQVTPESLAQLRFRARPLLVTLFDDVKEMRVAVAGCAAALPEAQQNLTSLERALGSLRRHLNATAEWHQHLSEPDKTIARRQKQPAAVPAKATSGYFRARTAGATILVVDDLTENRALLRQRLEREGFNIRDAAGGPEAFTLMAEEPVDLVLLDVLMAGMDGLEVLRQMKSAPELENIPVIMISAQSEAEQVVQCIQSGAEDYLYKPFNPVLLLARIRVTLERKRLRDEEEQNRVQMAAILAELTAQRETASKLLLNILPASVAEDLKQGHCAPMYFEDTTICFTDFVGFTLATETMAAEEVVEELHIYFSAFDRVIDRYGLEKLKTIGDSYMFASGLPQRNPANPINALMAAMELAEETKRLAARPGSPAWQLRIGLHTGPVIAGVVGTRKFAFDIWGDSVNFASRMESSGAAGRINISDRTYSRVKDFFQCEHRGKVATKDEREVDMFFVNGIQPKLLEGNSLAAFERRYKLYFSQQPPALPDYLIGTAN